MQDAFLEFEQDTVRVPKSENEAAKEVHPQIRATLEADLGECLETFLSGSYSRRVQAVKLKDVDIIVVLDDPTDAFRASAKAALEEIRKVSVRSHLVKSATARVRSVRLVLYDYEFTIDLVAALESDNGADGLLLARHLPEEGLDDWTLGHPRGQREAAIAKNEQCGGVYIPAVRLVKYWLTTVWGTGQKPLRSYHAEAILHAALTKKVDYPTAIVQFFDAAEVALRPGVFTADPGAPGTYVDERLEAHERREAREGILRGMAAAHAAHEEDDVEAALDAWVEVFGAAFPAPKTSLATIAAGLATRTAGAVGAGIQVGRGRQVIESRPWGKSQSA